MSVADTLLEKYFRKQKMMRTVILSLIPIVIYASFLYGLRVLVLLSAVTIAGVLAEHFWEKRIGGKASEAVLVTSILYTLTLPASTPLWIAILGILFGLFFGKLVFGGFGRNIFNPALVGRAFIYVNFPEPLTISWNEVSTSGLLRGFSTYLTDGIDAISQGTPMVLYDSTQALIEFPSLFLGTIPGSIGETSKFLIIIAGIYLIRKKVASWEIMAGCIIGFVATNFILLFANVPVPNPLYNMLLGGFLFGTVFMATDPISAAKTKEGKWIFGIIIGLVTVLIRALSLFNGGMMFAILIGNTFAPIIDYFIREAKAKKKMKREVAS